MKKSLTKITLAVVITIFASVAFAAFKNNPIHVVHYDVSISPDLRQKSVAGKTALSFESLSDGLDHLSFLVHELKVKSVSIQGKSVPFSLSEGILTIQFKKKLLRGQSSQVEVAYEGIPTSGIVFGENSVYTSYDTCYWMICDQDNPGDKATLQLTLDVPKNLDVVASGSETQKISLSHGLVRHVWTQAQPYSAYLFGFAAGVYKSSHAKAGKTDLYFFSDVFDEDKLTNIFQDPGKIVAFFEEKSGIPFPHERYSQVVVSGSEAQEVSTYSVLGSDHVQSVLSDPKEEWAIIHELAHQWWGNYITCASWDHFWLNEGLVVFMTAAYKEHRWGKAEYDKEMDIAKKRYQMAKDAGFDVPITKGQSLATLKMRRAIVYSKGALFLDALRKQMGEAAFWGGLKEYSIKYAGKTVESKDFEKIMVARGNAETDQLFQKWVF